MQHSHEGTDTVSDNDTNNKTINKTNKMNCDSSDSHSPTKPINKSIKGYIEFRDKLLEESRLDKGKLYGHHEQMLNLVLDSGEN